MKFYLITFRSATLAQRAERVLEQNNLSCRVRRTPKWMEERGCGYAVEIRLTEPEQALVLLRRQGISFRKWYPMSQDGTVEVGKP